MYNINENYYKINTLIFIETYFVKLKFKFFDYFKMSLFGLNYTIVLNKFYNYFKCKGGI